MSTSSQKAESSPTSIDRIAADLLRLFNAQDGAAVVAMFDSITLVP
jgi:hypothetical protein